MKSKKRPTRFSKALLIPAMTGFAALLIGNGIGRLGYPPLIPALISKHWFTVAEADYLGASNLTGYIIGSASASFINRYIPTVNLVKAALITVALTFAACAIPFGFPFYFCLRFLAGLMGGVIMVVTPATIMKTIPDAVKGTVSGIIFSGVGIGVALMGTLVPYMIAFGLPVTWLFYAALSITLIAVFWKGWPNGSNSKNIVEDTTGRESTAGIWNHTIILLLISYGCNAIGFVPHTVFWVDFIARGLHLGINTGMHFWILLGLSAAAGPVITGFMADKIGFAKSIRISLLIKAIGVLMPVFTTALWSLAISSIFVGSLALGIASLTAGRITELVLPNLQKRVWSYMTITFSITHAATAYLLSYLFSRTGSYYFLFEIGAIMLIIGSVLDFLGSLSPKLKLKKNKLK